ncbi:MAG: 5'-methylthioadenosine/adenosylhomocysteine nucleosidase [Clostridia bacterium]|nr:5'-methylthioadenosine/adenosylhomocysteine nucleosidase [Clostridia bacterium]
MQNKVDIGIIGAMQIEIDGIKALMENSVTINISGIEFVKGSISGKSIVTAVCGIGKVFSAVCAQTMILGFNPDVIINMGVAGTLTDELSIGDVAVADKVVQHDIDTTALGDEPGLISGLNVVYIPTDDKISGILAESVKEIGLKCKTGTIATGDCFINDNNKKQSIIDNFSAIACEMEGGAIAQACYINNVPFSILRAISDGGDENSHLDYSSFLKKAAEASIEVIKKFIVRWN